MTDNIIDITKLRDAKQIADNRSALSTEFDRERLDRLRASQVRAKFTERPRIENSGQRVLIAQNMWKILNDLEQRGFRKANVVREAGLGDMLSSTKRLYNYALNPSCDDEMRADAAKRLTKTVTKYALLSDKAAEISGISKDQLLLGLVAGTQYDVARDGDGSSITVTNDFSYGLSAFLSRLGGKIAKRHNLEGFFKYLARRNLAYDWRTDTFDEKHSPFVNVPDPIRVGEWMNGGSVTAFAPAIPLFFRQVGIYDCEYSIGFGAPEDEGQPAFLGELTGAGIASVYRNVSLGFAPVGPGNTVELCFILEIQTNYSAGFNDNNEFEAETSSLPMFGQWALVGDAPGRQSGKVYCFITGDAGDRAKEAPSPHRCSYVEPVSPNSCETLLSVTDWDFMIGTEGFEHTTHSQFYAPTSRTSAPGDSVAQAIEKNFYRDDKEHRIDHLLSERVAKMVAALEKYRSEADRMLAIRRSQLLREWD